MEGHAEWIGSCRKARMPALGLRGTARRPRMGEERSDDSASPRALPLLPLRQMFADGTRYLRLHLRRPALSRLPRHLCRVPAHRLPPHPVAEGRRRLLGPRPPRHRAPPPAPDGPRRHRRHALSLRRRRRRRGGQAAPRARPRLDQRHPALRERPRYRLDLPHRRLPAGAKMAQGPQGPGAWLRGRPPLCPHREDTARDRSYHGRDHHGFGPSCGGAITRRERRQPPPVSPSIIPTFYQDATTNMDPSHTSNESP